MEDRQKAKPGLLNVRLVTLVALTLAAAATRLLPHPPNFTPLAALALFGGTYFTSPRAAFAVPLAAMFFSDLALGLLFYGMAIFPMMPFVYASFALTVMLGFWVRRRCSPVTVGTAALAASVLFFAITNFGVWLRGRMYARTPEGLAACYAAALPFFQNTLAGDAIFTLVLFGGFALAQHYVPALREPAPLLAHE